MARKSFLPFAPAFLVGGADRGSKGGSDELEGLIKAGVGGFEGGPPATPPPLVGVGVDEAMGAGGGAAEGGRVDPAEEGGACWFTEPPGGGVAMAEAVGGTPREAGGGGGGGLGASVAGAVLLIHRLSSLS